MILYHGTNINIQSIDLSQCMPYKDFGQGFYLTDIDYEYQGIFSTKYRQSNDNLSDE